MEQAFYFFGSIVLLFGAILLGLKAIELNQKRIADKFQTNQNHFLSDLYKLQTKWAGAGEFGYAESLGNLIKLHGKIEEKAIIGGLDLPLTNDAMSTSIQLKNRRKEEIKEAMEEVLQTEFIG